MEFRTATNIAAENSGLSGEVNYDNIEEKVQFVASNDDLFELPGSGRSGDNMYMYKTSLFIDWNRRRSLHITAKSTLAIE